MSFSQTGRILTIKDAQLDDAGNYTCLATQAGIPDVHRYASAVLTVQGEYTHIHTHTYMHTYTQEVYCMHVMERLKIHGIYDTC